MSHNVHTRKDLQSVLQELSEAAAKPFTEATPIPAALNHSLAFLEHEQASVFRQEWICVGREDELPSVGDFLTHQIASVPVLVVRQANHEIQAFVNACAHRRACVVSAASGTAKKFTCPYHAWTYDCGGRLIRAPGMEMKAGFDESGKGLKPLKSAVWEGFVYVSLSQNPATDLNQVLEPLRENIVGRYNMSCYRTVLRENMTWNANWKNLIENFTESYHVPVAHGKTFAQHNKPLEDYICGEDSDYYGYHRAPQQSETGKGAAHPGNDRLQGEWRRMMIDFCVFPCHLITLMPDYLWYISVQPAGTDQMLATWGLAVPPEVLADVKDSEYESWLADFKTYMEVANDEDKALVEALHRGSASSILPEGHYHPMERNLWQFTRYLARVCKAD